MQQGEDDDSSGVKLSRKELKKLKKQKQYSDQLEALKSEDQFTLSQAEKSSKSSNLTDNALDIKVSSVYAVLFVKMVKFVRKMVQVSI